MKKRAVYTILGVLFLIAFGRLHISYAADTIKVSAVYDAIYKVNDNTYIVPLYIVDNPGIMGFRIDIGYDPDLLRIDTISKGKVTSDGNFNNNIATAEKSGNVSVWWNSTDNVVGDGSLMYITVSILDAPVDTLSLNITYSQEDTFNSEWKDVELDCYSIDYPIQGSVIGIGEETKKNDDVNVKEETSTEKSSEEKQNIVDEKQSELDQQKGTPTEDIVYKAYDEKIVPDNIVSDEGEKTFLDTAIKAADSVAEVSKIGDDKVKRALARKMKEYGIRDSHDIPEKQQYEFWNAVAEDLISIEGVDEKSISNIDVAKLSENIIVTSEDIENADLLAKPVAKKSTRKNIYIWFEAAALILIFVGIIIIRRRRK